MEYFGGCDSNGDPSGDVANSDQGYCFWNVYTCPGSGDMLASLFQSLAYGNGGDTGLRLGLYNSDGTTLLQQTGQISIPYSPEAWYGPTDLAWTLAGGSVYTLAWASDSVRYAVGSNFVDDTRSMGNYKASVAYYSDGFPSSLPTPDSVYSTYPMRIGVNPANPWVPQENATEKIIRVTPAMAWR